MRTFADLLEISAAVHRHLCPRQVLGVRMGLYAGAVLQMPLPQTDKRLYTIVETDGALDGIAAATGCTPGHRTLRMEDFGKVAATFVDIQSGRAIRLAPRPTVRARAELYAPGERTKWQAQLVGYQRMPPEELLELQEVHLLTPVERWISRPRCKAICEHCGEEIMNEREVVREGTTLCRACAGESYYALLAVMPEACAVEVAARHESRRAQYHRGG